MKKFFIVFIMIALMLPLFADDPNMQDIDLSSIEITAYKTRIIDQISPTYQVRLLDAESVDFSETTNALVNIPLHARYDSGNPAYKAFSWVLSGNVFCNVSFAITFGAMYWRDSGGHASEPIIPYNVELVHSSSRIGNTIIPVGRPSDSVSYVSFNGYEFKYADSVVLQNNNVIVDSNNRTRTINITYSLQNYTVYTPTDSGTPTVCDYWNRSGGAYFVLGIDSSGTKIDLTTGRTVTGGTPFVDGAYYADVSVVISAN